MEYHSGGGWSDWKHDYRYGALVIEPPEVLTAVLDPIRTLQLVERAAGPDPKGYVALTVLGAAFYRTGRNDAALERLT